MKLTGRSSALYCAAVAALAAIPGFSPRVEAATKTWNGLGADAFVSTGGNWVGGTAPTVVAGSGTTADDWVFTGATQLHPLINLGTSSAGNLVQSITFDANAAAFTLEVQGTNFAQMGTTAIVGGNITNNSTNTQTLLGNFAPRTGIVNAVNGQLVFNSGTIQLGNLGLGTINAVDTRTITYSGIANITLHSQISSSGKLQKSGNNTLFIDGNNDYFGTTQIGAGAIQISSANALGLSGTNKGTLISGNAGGIGRLELAGGITFAPEVLTLEARQGASSALPHLVNVSGDNTWTGAINVTTGGSEYTIRSSAGSLNITGNINNNITGGIRNMYFDGAANGTVNGQILNTSTAIFTITKNGAGTWTFNGANTYNGTVTVNAGTLVLANSNTTPGPVVVNSGTLKVLSTGSINSVQSIGLTAANSTFDVSDFAGSGGFILPSNSRLSGAGVVKGLVNASSGNVVAGGSLTAPATLTFQNGLSLSSGSTIQSFISGSNRSLIDVTGGSLSGVGSNSIVLQGAGFGIGQIPVLHYTGSLGGDGFGAFNLTQLPARAVGTLVDNSANHSIDVNITAIDFPKWTGAQDTVWDINNSPNWKEVNSGNVTTYLESSVPGDAVLFDDTATGSTLVNLSSTVSPSLITANNSTKTYEISNFGSISGPGSFTKNGTGTFILSNSGQNTYTAGTFVNAGTLQIGGSNGTGGSIGSGPVSIAAGATLIFRRDDDQISTNIITGTGTIRKQGAGVLTLGTLIPNYSGTIIVDSGTLKGTGELTLGSSNSAVLVMPGATFDTNFAQVGARTITASGSGVGGLGAIINNGVAQNNSLENVVLTGDTTFGGNNRWDIRNLGNTTRLFTNGNAYNLTKVGGNTIGLVDVTIDPALANVNINQGLLTIEGSTNGIGDPTKTVTIAQGATLQAFNLSTPLNKVIVSNGGTLSTASGNGTYSGTITMNSGTINLNATSATFNGPVIFNPGTLGVNVINLTTGTANFNATTAFNSDVTIQGAAAGVLNTALITGTGSLIKTLPGTLNLSSALNSYSGSTVLSAGLTTITSVANGGTASSLGASSALASNLQIGGATAVTTLRYLGTTGTSTDRGLTLNGLVTLDASGTAGAFVAFTNTNAAVVNNPGTATALALTLTGSNTDNNVLGASLSNYNASGTGAAAVLSISKTGNSVWALTGNSSFTGNVVVAGGILKPRSNGALGTGNQVQINDNTANATPASVVLDNPAGVTIANNFRTTGSGAGNANPDGVGVIRSMAGSNVLSGVLTLSSGGGFSTYTVDAGSTLTLSGTVTNDTARTLDMGGAGVGNISGVISNGVGAQSLEKRGTGTWIVSGTNNTFTGSTVVGVGTLQVTGSIATSSGVTASGGKFDAASAQMVKTLTVNTGGTAVVSGALKALTVGDNSSAAPLTIANGKLDLAGNGLIVDVAPGNEATALASVRASILSGFNASSPAAGDGTWNGNGIISSTAAANTSSKGVGYALSTDILPSGGTFLGSTVDTSAVLARYTLLGDATLDGTVDFNDLVQLAQNYNVTDGTRTWFTGDFTYDGNVDFNDLVKLAQNYNSALPAAGIPGAPASFAADWALAVSAVPEPTSLGLVGVAAAGLLRRRRRAR